MRYPRESTRTIGTIHPDYTRGEERFASEVTLARLHGKPVPTFAQHRAEQVLERLAGGA